MIENEVEAFDSLGTFLDASYEAVLVCREIEAHADDLKQGAIESDRASSFAIHSLSCLQRLGVTAICAPKEMGGRGITSLSDICFIVATISKYDASLGLALSMHFALTVYFARDYQATSCVEQKQRLERWLKALVQENMIVSSAVSERGTQPWQIQTLAVPTANGFSIRGQKDFVSLAPVATHFYTRVKVEIAGDVRHGTFMIPRHTPGVEVDATWNGIGLRGSGSGKVCLNHVQMKHEDFLDRGKWGVKPTNFNGRAAGTIPIVASYLGIVEAAYTQIQLFLAGAVLHQPSSFERQLVADASIKRFSARSAFAYGVKQIELAQSTKLDDQGTHFQLRACLQTGRVVEKEAIEIIDIAMQICGGRSYQDGEVLAQLCRDVRGAFFMGASTPPNGWTDLLYDSIQKEIHLSHLRENNLTD